MISPSLPLFFGSWLLWSFWLTTIFLLEAGSEISATPEHCFQHIKFPVKFRYLKNDNFLLPVFSQILLGWPAFVHHVSSSQPGAGYSSLQCLWEQQSVWVPADAHAGQHAPEWLRCLAWLNQYFQQSPFWESAVNCSLGCLQLPTRA